MTDATAKTVARILLDHKAVLLQPNDPFTWASGIKSPIYTDNRQLMSYPEARKVVSQALATLIKTNYPEVTVIAGTATAGIPHAAWVSDLLNLPMIYVRSKAKDHGRQSQIEGFLKPDDKIVLIDDLISTGGSVLEAAKAVEQTHKVLGVASIFTYAFQSATDNFANAKLPYHSLADYPTLIQTAAEDGRFSAEEIEKLNIWHQHYAQN
ncbi:MAG: orotate phosphoribosyltransferase [Aerococcus sp.]|nr:orotate phosphoribosyltransferase [Aerococcus sp.]